MARIGVKLTRRHLFNHSMIVLARGGTLCISGSLLSKFQINGNFFLTGNVLSSAPGLDWSEESGEEPEDSEQASPYQVAWSIRETLRYDRHM